MLALILALFLSAPGGATYFEKVDAQYRAGEISASQHFTLRELALKDPAALPESYRQLLERYPIKLKSGTSVLVQNFQKARRLGLKANYSFPSDMAYYVDSDTFPIRVFYDRSDQASLAQNLLGYAEHAWQKEIVEWGFYAPPIVRDDGKYPVYLGNASGAAGYTAPLDVYPETEWDDCVTYIVIEEGMHEWMMADTMAHELNHASQAAMDCMEPTAFWENTAVFVETALYPQSIQMAAYYSEAYQMQPYRSISGGDNGDMYWYGGYLWPLFLAAHLGGDGSNAVFVRQLWERSMQSSNFMANSPNYMYAIDQVAQEQGTTLHEVFDAFVRARYFVDSKYDSALSEMPFASQIYPSPTLGDTLTLSEEKQSFTPASNKQPEEYAVNYVRLERPESFDRVMKITFAPSSGGSWRLQLFSEESADVEPIVVAAGDGLTELTYEPALYGDALLAVERVGENNFNPAYLKSTEGYSVTIEPAVKLPVINMVSPNAVTQGTSQVVTIYGGNFQEGVQVSIPAATGITVDSVAFESAGKLLVSLTVGKDAPATLYNVLVVNPDDTSFEGEQLLTVLEGASDPGGDDKGFGCSSTGGSSGLPLSLLLLLGFALTRRLF